MFHQAAQTEYTYLYFPRAEQMVSTYRPPVGRGDIHILHGNKAHAFRVKGLYASVLWQPRDRVRSERLPKEQR